MYKHIDLNNPDTVDPALVVPLDDVNLIDAIQLDPETLAPNWVPSEGGVVVKSVVTEIGMRS